MTIDLLPEQITEIVREDLVYLLETFEDDIQKVIETGEDANVFSKDVEEEIEYLIKKKLAIKEVLELFIVK